MQVSGYMLSEMEFYSLGVDKTKVDRVSFSMGGISLDKSEWM